MPSEHPATWRSDPSPVLIGAAIARFRDPAFAARPLPPFPAYVEQPAAQGRPALGWRTRPRFGVLGRSRRVVEVATGPGVSFYGTGEQAGPLLRSGRRVTLWNNDNFDYTAASRNLYQSHPFVLAVRPDGSAFGVIIETTYRCDIDLSRGIRIVVHGPSPAVAIIERASPQEVVEALGELTGRTPMPPLWALGYHQCRWSYEPDTRVKEVAAEFRARRMPCDVIWLDIDYMDGFRCFTFDAHKFPNPGALNVDLRAMGFRTIYMIDPGLKVDPAYHVYAQAKADGHLITTAAGEEYHGEVWPGACAFPDFTSARTRAWWAGLYEPMLETGADGFWNDMNEPAVFRGVEKTMPATNRHNADAELGGPDSHARYHNVYGMLMVRASREGITAHRPGLRPFLLTRSNFLGGQRYAATWTGDNRSDWNHLRWSISMALNLGLSGQPFAGPDIGGFIGNADGELFARWMGLGSLLPFARGHSEKTTGHHEPWAFGPECENNCRAALERRYRLLPYIYTLFHEASTRGTPVARPLFFADPTDRRLRACDNAFLLGADLLVQCDVSPSGTLRGASPPSDGALRPVMPRGVWKPLEGIFPSGQNLPRLYLRAGAILPIGPVRQWVDEPVESILTLAVAPDSQAQAQGSLYEDSGDGFAFEQGDMRMTSWVWAKSGPAFEASVQGTRASGFSRVQTLVV
jgi:alpha-glucosidase